MSTTVHVIMPTPVRRAVCVLCTGQDALALLRTARPFGQPPASVRRTSAAQAEKLLAGGHKGIYAHLDKVEFVKASKYTVCDDFTEFERRVPYLVGGDPDKVARDYDAAGSTTRP